MRITSTRSLSPISRELDAQAVAGVDLRRVQAVQQQVHLAEQVRQRLGLAAEDASRLERARGPATVLHCFSQVLERFDEEAAGAARRVEHRFAEPRIDDLRP